MKKNKKRYFSRMSKLAKRHPDAPGSENKLASIYKQKKRIKSNQHDT